MATNEDNLNRFLNEFILWRKEKDYPSLVSLGVYAEKRFKIDLAEFKEEKALSNG